MAAVFELLLFAAAAIAALLFGRRSGKQGKARGGTMRCPSCGSPAERRGGRWECPYCGDSGNVGRPRRAAVKQAREGLSRQGGRR